MTGTSRPHTTRPSTGYKDKEINDHEDRNYHEKPLFFTRMLVHQPTLVMLLVLLAVGGSFAAATMRPFLINTGFNGAFRVAGDRTSELQDSFEVAEESTHSPSSTDIEDELSRNMGYTLLLYEAPDGNVFSEKHIKRMRQIEWGIRDLIGFTDVCFRGPSSSDNACLPHNSVLNYFYQSKMNISVMGNLVEIDIPDGKGDSLASNLTEIVVHLAENLDDEKVKYFTEKSFSISNLTNGYTRSVIPFGSPMAGYRNIADRRYEQRKKLESFTQSTVAPLLEKARAEAYADPTLLKVHWLGTGLSEKHLTDIIFSDVPYLAGSILFVFVFIVYHTKSFFLSCMGTFHILLSFPLTYFCMIYVFNYIHVGMMDLLSFFVIIGIGADDIFVMVDAFKQSGNKHAKSLIRRMDFAFRRGASSMLITSLTTAGAFGANAASIIPLIREFGIFSAMVVVFNYLLVITWFPAMMVIWEKKNIEVRQSGKKPSRMYNMFWFFPSNHRVDAVRLGITADLDGDAIVETMPIESISEIHHGEVARSHHEHDMQLQSKAKSKPSGGGGDADADVEAYEHELEEIETLGTARRHELEQADADYYNNTRKMDYPESNDLNESMGSSATLARIPRLNMNMNTNGNGWEDDENENAPTDKDKGNGNKVSVDGLGTARFTLPVNVKRSMRHNKSVISNASQSAMIEVFRPVSRFMYFTWAPFIRKFKWVIVVLFLVAMVVGGVYTGMNLRASTDADSFLPLDHGMIRLRDITEDYMDDDTSLIKVNIVYGVRGRDLSLANKYDLADKGLPIWDEDFNPRTSDAQLDLVETCDLLFQQGTWIKPRYLTCVMSAFKEWVLNTNGSFPVPEDDFESMLRDFHQQNATFKRNIGWNSAGQLKYMALSFNTTANRRWSYQQREPHYNHWESFVASRNTKSVPGVNKAFQTTEAWVDMRTDSVIVTNGYMGVLASVVIATGLLVFSTGNVITGLVASLGIVGIVATVGGVMVGLRWEIGPVEAICMTVLVGLSVDYSVHLAAAYSHNSDDKVRHRYDRMRRALFDLGISILGAGITTIGCGLVMMMVSLNFITKFGTFKVFTILFSCLFSFFFFSAMMMICGPEFPSERGSLGKVSNMCPIEDSVSTFDNADEEKGDGQKEVDEEEEKRKQGIFGENRSKISSRSVVIRPVTGRKTTPRVQLEDV